MSHFTDDADPLGECEHEEANRQADERQRFEAAWRDYSGTPPNDRDATCAIAWAFWEMRAADGASCAEVEASRLPQAGAAPSDAAVQQPVAQWREKAEDLAMVLARAFKSRYKYETPGWWQAEGERRTTEAREALHAHLATSPLPTAPAGARMLTKALDFIETVHDGEYGYSECTRDELADEIRAALAAAPLDRPDEKYDDVLKPFLTLMRRELHANSGKGDRPGWLAMRADEALLEVYYHLSKLQKAVKHNDGPAIMEYSADVANMAMMVLDICGGLAWVEAEHGITLAQKGDVNG